MAGFFLELCAESQYVTTQRPALVSICGCFFLQLFAELQYMYCNSCKFGYCNWAASFYFMLRNVHECTMHKLHGWMCVINLWCTLSELKAPSDYSKRKRAPKVLTKASLIKLMYCQSVMENAGGKFYVIVLLKLDEYTPLAMRSLLQGGRSFK